MTKEDYLKLSGRESTAFAKEQLNSGKWTMEQYLTMLKYWMKFHN